MPSRGLKPKSMPLGIPLGLMGSIHLRPSLVSCSPKIRETREPVQPPQGRRCPQRPLTAHLARAAAHSLHGRQGKPADLAGTALDLAGQHIPDGATGNGKESPCAAFEILLSTRLQHSGPAEWRREAHTKQYLQHADW